MDNKTIEILLGFSEFLLRLVFYHQPQTWFGLEDQPREKTNPSKEFLKNMKDKFVAWEAT